MKKILSFSAVFVAVLLFSGCTLLDRPALDPVPQEPQPVEPKGITVELPNNGENIQSPLSITGTAGGDGWVAFEAQTGTVELLDGNGQAVAFGLLVATIEQWMTLPVPFETTLIFDPPATREGTLVFRNENPSGLEELERELRVPVTFGSVAEKISVKVFFGSSTAGAMGECENVLPVEREIARTPAVGRAALEELFKGPSEQEKEQGFLTSINLGVEIQSLAISEGVARADFSRELEQGAGGSCRVAAIRAQIEQTLKQFSTVDEVVISIDGRTDDILQP